MLMQLQVRLQKTAQITDLEAKKQTKTSRVTKLDNFQITKRVEWIF